jgi:hypothetical protein
MVSDIPGVASVLILVTGSDGERNASLDSGVDGVVDRLGETSTERHVGDRTPASGSPGRLALIGDVVDAIDNAIVSAATVAIEDLDGDEPDTLGNTISSSADGTSDVSAVTCNKKQKRLLSATGLLAWSSG